MGEPLVSIIIPLYNSETYISEAIETVLNQTYNNWELIIIDDCSTDQSYNIVTNYQKNDERINLLKLTKNSGSAVARNLGIKEAKGDFIAFLDSDDLWEKNKLENQINFMIINKYFFTYTDYSIINEEKNTIKVIKAPKILTYQKELLYNHIGTSTVVYNSSILGKIYFPDLRKRQDYACWLRILKNNINGYGLNIPLTRYRIRNDSLSSNKFSLIKYNWQVFRKSEKFGILKSSFYLFTNISAKILRIKERQG